VHAPSLSTFLLGEGAQRIGSGTQNPERRLNVNVDHRLELFVGRSGDGRIPEIARIVDNDIEPAKPLDRRLNETLRKIRCGNVAVYRNGIATCGDDARRHRVTGLVVKVVYHDPGTLAGEFERDCATDPATGP
jgi:hypothetical protein